MRSFKSNENIHKKEGGSYYVVSANKASSSLLKSHISLVSLYWFQYMICFIVQLLTVKGKTVRKKEYQDLLSIL